MIIANIIGGLGNQMFQYAVGRAISLRVSEPLKLDISNFAHYSLHQGYQLPTVFACNPEIATDQDVLELLRWRGWGPIRKVLMRPSLAILHGDKLLVEPHYHYWTGIKHVSKNIYMSGYWQSEKYFCDVSESIRADFAFRQPFSRQNAELAEMIGKTSSVSLHVRRGDYVSHSKTNAVLGLCSLEYYRSAILHIAKHVENPQFFIFSDDIPWVRKMLKIDFPAKYVDHNQGSDSYNDMRLMSLCRHNITANSSFSWWGAWLNNYPNKVVISPRNWFAKDNYVDDLFPAGWVTL